jgi:hypothetical protein
VCRFFRRSVKKQKIEINLMHKLECIGQHQQLIQKMSTGQTFTRCGAGAARAAHNREVIRSKRIAGIYHHIAMVHRGTGATFHRGSSIGRARGS